GSRSAANMEAHRSDARGGGRTAIRPGELAAAFACLMLVFAAPLGALAQSSGFGDGFVRLARGGAPPPPPPPPACTPTTCAAQGKNCGTIPNGCGGTLTCGACTAPQTCGGARTANVRGVVTPPPATPAHRP